MELNPAQAEAATLGIADGKTPPLLIIAGAGSGKTKTLSHRVAQLVMAGADPNRILLLTFTRRAAQEMTRRVQALVGQSSPSAGRLAWSGTFHSIANRLLRLHGAEIGLSADFTVLDRSDAADLMDVLRNRLGFSKTARRFPKKGTCLSIYSRVVNTQSTLPENLRAAFPWCLEWEVELRALFRAYVEAKQARNVLDYDDLLLFWFHLMSEPKLAASVGGRFDHVLVDEYQDTNALQAAILKALKPSGEGVTVVGDDAQAIYSFRGATVRNILDFPEQYSPPARRVTLEQNYRSTRPILDAANAVIGLAKERFTKDLFSTRASHQKPRLVSMEDETAQVDCTIERILAHREEGVPLKHQAVLVRAAHHTDGLELELARRNIPFVKYGGLRFLEAAHVKDLLCILRWAENPRDAIAAFRVLQLLPGVGPRFAERLAEERELEGARVPAAAQEGFAGLVELLGRLRKPGESWPEQIGWTRKWYEPELERLYDGANVRKGDLEQLERIAASYPTRERFLSELTLDPPEATGDHAGPPLLDEDYLILSTIHSAKGQEWDAVYVLNVVDGCIPSDMAAGSPEELEEERRLLYVAMTRAKDALYLMQPLKMYVGSQRRGGDRHLYVPRSRFLPDEVLAKLDRQAWAPAAATPESARPARQLIDVNARLRGMWD